MEIFDIFFRGGLLMWVILLVSIVALTVFIERMWATQRASVVPRDFVDKVREKVLADKLDDAALLCEDSKVRIAKVFAAIIANKDASFVIIKEATEDAGRVQAAGLERFTGALGVCASISPLLGLLGTVTGMIQVFQRVAESGVGNPLDMAAGIWEALVTTAFGLAVGIPALIAHRYVLSRVDRLTGSMEEEAAAMANLVAAKS